MFKFRLQNVLDLRVEREQKAASELSQAKARVRAAEEAKAALESSIAEGYARMAAANAARSVGEMRSRSYVLDQLGERVSRAAEAIDKAVAEVENSHRDFQAAFKGRMALDRLKERQREDWREEEGRAERAEMDEVARNRVHASPGQEEET